MARSVESTTGDRAAMLAETGLVRAARYIQPGEPSVDGRVITGAAGAKPRSSTGSAGATTRWCAPPTG